MKQSLTELRAMAQRLQIPWDFSDSVSALQDRISSQQKTPVQRETPEPRPVNTAPKKHSMTELRGLAQSMGIKFKFSDDRNALQQKINMRQTEMLPPIPLPVVTPPEDQRLRVKPPSKVSDEKMINDLLAPHIRLGLEVTVEDGRFQMKFKDRTDSGTLRQPPRVILNCANRLLQ